MLQRLQCEYDGEFYLMDLAADQFVHFTLPERAKQILRSGKLLLESPYHKFGIDAVAAVSTVWGSFTPKVQTMHINGDLVAVVFRTRTMPEVGYPEEVLWKRDVMLQNPRVVSFTKGRAMLGGPDGDFSVYYAVPDWCTSTGRVAARYLVYQCGPVAGGSK